MRGEFVKPTEAFGMRGFCANNEKGWVVLENEGRFWKAWVRVNESPNAVRQVPQNPIGHSVAKPC